MSGDGGYVVSELEGYDALYSYGCNDMITFEKETEPFPLKGLDVPTDINRAELCLNYWL